jgi:hypothetical protein
MDGKRKATPGAAIEPPPYEDPCRPPDWRFQVAASAALNGQLLRRREHDRLTVELNTFLLDDQFCSTPADQAALRRLRLPTAAAVQLFRQRDRVQAASVEAFALARLADGEIARRVHLPSGVVHRYLAYFFHVGSRLDDRAYILQRAIFRRAAACDSPPADYAETLKAVAYLSGRQALEHLLVVGGGDARQAWTTMPSFVAGALELNKLRQLTKLLRADAASSSPGEFARWAGEFIDVLSRGPLAATAPHPMLLPLPKL